MLIILICMRKIIIFFVVVFFTLPVSAITYETYSPYWTSHTNSSGPKSEQGAINSFFLDRKLEMIEGIWQEDDYGTVAIVKMSSTKFEKYVIYTSNYELNGTKEATIFLNPNTNTHNMFIRIEWKTENGFKYATSKANLNYINKNELSSYIFDYVDDKISEYTRIWPADIIEYNQSFSNKDKIANNQEDSKSDPDKKAKDLNNFLNLILVVLTLIIVPSLITLLIIQFFSNKKIILSLKNQSYGYTLIYFSLLGYWSFERFFLGVDIYDATIGVLIILLATIINFLLVFLILKTFIPYLIKNVTILSSLSITALLTSLLAMISVLLL